jgi:rhodanese-related sulfurtransferase
MPKSKKCFPKQFLDSVAANRDSMKSPAPAQTTEKLILPVLAMLVASILLGAAYNSASPLGVHSAKSKDSSVSPLAPAISGSRTGYVNETVSLVLEGVSGTRPAGGVYGNQTMALGLAPAQPGSPAPAVKHNLPSLTWPEVKALLKDTQNVLVDARVVSFYQAEHIPGAISLPSNSPTNELAAFVAKYPKTTPLIVYCGSSSCPMAHHLAELLSGSYGYSNVKLMPGGFAEYRTVEAQAVAGGAK